MSDNFIPFHLPEIGEEEVNSVVETLRSGWLTTGAKAKAFEASFGSYVGASHAVAVNSCTAALHLSLEAIGIREGDEVIVPTMTFTATAEVVLYFKAKPVLVDCEADTLNIDAAKLEAAITPRTKAIIPVHFAGHPCDMKPILDIARRHNLFVVEDAAHALPARYDGQLVGAIGDITCFSFYATKTIATGEGGMATTENQAWAQRMRMMSLHGISHDAWKRYTKEGSWYYEVLSPGFKYNLTDIAAAIGIEQLKKAERFCAARQEIASTYDKAFAHLPQIELPVTRGNVQHAWHLYVIKLNLSALTIDRNQFVDKLRDLGVGASVHFIPLHLHPFYRDNMACRKEAFPVATSVFERILSIPIYPKMTSAQIGQVIEAVRDIAVKHRR